MTHANRQPRRGMALIWALVVLAMTSFMIASITWQVLAHRRFLEHRQHRLQAQWLARSGLEIAAARLLDNPKPFVIDHRGLLPDSLVRITVAPGKEPNTFVAAAAASYPESDPHK